MKIFNLDSPLMQFLGRMADLLWLNILTTICCIPIITIGPALTAMHYMCLKMVRNEECYITRGYFKSFKENFKQATIIWLVILFMIVILVGDFVIMRYGGISFPKVLQILITAVGVLILITATFVFPVLARFDNTILRTIKNAFMISILQFPKTILMIIMGLIVPPLALVFLPQATPIVFLFGLALPAYASAMLYNKFFKKLEDQMLSQTAGTDGEEAKDGEESEEDERIFRDELDEALIESGAQGTDKNDTSK